jgi:hypothetical protein
MTGATQHRLQGLEPDNFLAFLALLGALRSLETAEPTWKPRVHWDIVALPTRPVLTLATPTSAPAICEAVARGCDVLAESHQFGPWKVPNMPSAEARKLLLAATAGAPDCRLHSDVLACLMSDIAAREDGSVIPTPLCLLFGQGDQYFLTRLADVPNRRSAPPRGNGKNSVTPSPAETIEAAIFRVWERVDPSDSFRWDHAEDRRYALRFGNPSDDKSLTVHGANRLAAVGLPVLSVVPATVRGRVRLQTIGVRQARAETQAVWPIWTRPASLSGIRALMTHPALYGRQSDNNRARLQNLGVIEVRCAARVSVGKFLNFARAVAV